jgi:hypothetical protein
MAYIMDVPDTWCVEPCDRIPFRGYGRLAASRERMHCAVYVLWLKVMTMEPYTMAFNGMEGLPQGDTVLLIVWPLLDVH